MNIEKTLESFQPYVIGIRYVEKTAVVDAVFKDGWVIPESDKIKKVKGEEKDYYYMFFSELKNIGLDDILSHIRYIINSNQERELKLNLLKKKIDELKVIFKSTSLSKLKELKFSFSEEEPTIEDIGSSEMTIAFSSTTQTYPSVVDTSNEIYQAPMSQPNVEMTEEELEILEEERRGANYLRSRNDSKATLLEQNTAMVGKPCNCGEHEACPKCIDTKAY